jgi:hypothetical protein
MGETKHSRALPGILLMLVAGWAHRQTMLSYCVNTVRTSMEAKKVDVLPTQGGLAVDIPIPVRVGLTRGIKEEEVLVSPR